MLMIRPKRRSRIAGSRGRGQAARRREVQKERLLPLLFAGIERERAGAAGIVDQDIDRPQLGGPSAAPARPGPAGAAGPQR